MIAVLALVVGLALLALSVLLKRDSKRSTYGISYPKNQCNSTNDYHRCLLESGHEGFHRRGKLEWL